MIRAYLPALIIGALISAGLTYYVKKIAERFKLVDLPSPRKIHSNPIPRIGGVAIVIAFLILLIGYILASKRLNFGPDSSFFIDKKLIGVIAGLIVLLITGLLDDIRGLAAWQKFIWQLVASSIVVFFGFSLSFIRLPFGLHLDFTSLQIPIHLFGQTFQFVVWGDILAVIWIMILINTINFLDGIDGLASGVSFITAIVIFFLSITLGQDANALLGIIIAGVALGFIPWNFNPAKIFLGDSGSMTLGFLIGVLSLISGGKLATAFLVLGIPVLDVGWVVIRRIFSGKSPFVADKKHLHHRLLTAGFSQKQAVIFLYFLSIVFGSVAVLAQTQEKIKAIIILLAVMGLMIVGLIVMEWFKKRRLGEGGDG